MVIITKKTGVAKNKNQWSFSVCVYTSNITLLGNWKVELTVLLSKGFTLPRARLVAYSLQRILLNS